MDDKIQEIFIDQIDDPQDPMRSEISRDGLFDLADDIKKHGLINPITVRPKEKRFEVVAGHRRLSACKIAGKVKIECVVRDLSDQEATEIMIAENLKREDVNPVDEAVAVRKYMEATNADTKEAAHALGYSESWVLSRIEVGEMPDYLQEHLRKGQIKLGVALILNQIKHDSVRVDWVALAVRDGVSIAQAEYWLSDYKRQLLPGGQLHGETQGDNIYTPPSAIYFKCAIDGAEYDTRLSKSITIYEGNLPYFNEFVLAFRSPPADTELSPDLASEGAGR